MEMEIKTDRMNIYVYFLLTGTLNFLRALATLTARCPIMTILATPVRTTYPYSLDSTTIVTLERSQINLKKMVHLDAAEPISINI